MKKLLIFTIVMLALSGIFNSISAQPYRIPFGGSLPNDTAYTPHHLLWTGVARTPFYATSDTTKVFGINSQGYWVMRTIGLGELRWSDTLDYLATKIDLSTKQNDLGFTPENVANKVINLDTPNNVTYPTTQAIENAIDRVIVVNPVGVDDGVADATPEFQRAINLAFGVREVSRNLVTGAVTTEVIGKPARAAKIIVKSPTVFYNWKGILVKSVNGDSVNAQIYIPAVRFPTQANGKHSVSISIEGTAPPSDLESYIQAFVAQNEDSITGIEIRSTIVNDGSLYPSMISVVKGDSFRIGSVDIYPTTNTVRMANLFFKSNFVAGEGAQIGGIDMNYANQLELTNVRVSLDTASAGMQYYAHKVFGIRDIHPLTGIASKLTTCQMHGFKYGMVVSEHSILDNCAFFNNHYGTMHRVGFHDVEYRNSLFQGNIVSIGAGQVAPAGACNVFGTVRIERTPRTLYDISDTANFMNGRLQHSIGDFDTPPFGYDATPDNLGATILTTQEVKSGYLRLTNGAFAVTNRLGRPKNSSVSPSFGNAYVINAVNNNFFSILLDSVNTDGRYDVAIQTGNTNGGGLALYNGEVLKSRFDHNGHLYLHNLTATATTPTRFAVFIGANNQLVSRTATQLKTDLVIQELTSGTGTTIVGSAINNNLSTGVSGGQSVVGGTGVGQGLTLSSTSNATKGPINFGTSNYNEATNALTITSTTADFLAFTGSNATRAGMTFRATNSASQSTIYLFNDVAAFGSYGGLINGGSTNNVGNIFGVSRANRINLFADGANNLGIGFGTLNNTPASIGTNNIERMKISANGDISFAAIPTYSTGGYTYTVYNTTSKLLEKRSAIPSTDITGIPTQLSTTASGTGAATSIDVTLPLTPTWVQVDAGNAAAANISYITPITNGVRIFYAVAPVLGTNNLTYFVNYK